MMNKIKKWKIIYITAFLLIILFLLAPLRISKRVKRFIYSTPNYIPNSYTCLIPGAKVHKSGYPSVMLADRLLKGIELYQKGKVKRFLLSGDHGHKNYDEVNTMRKFLQNKGVPAKDIFMDHAGFNTYNSVARAKQVFEVNDVIIVTQGYHLPRSIYLARSLNLKAFGYIADKNVYPKIKKYKRREYLAFYKAIYEAVAHPKPKFLCPVIPITGPSKLSWD